MDLSLNIVGTKDLSHKTNVYQNIHAFSRILGLAVTNHISSPSPNPYQRIGGSSHFCIWFTGASKNICLPPSGLAHQFRDVELHVLLLGSLEQLDECAISFLFAVGRNDYVVCNHVHIINVTKCLVHSSVSLLTPSKVQRAFAWRDIFQTVCWR